MSERERLNPEVHAALIQAAATLTGAYYNAKRPYGGGQGTIAAAFSATTSEQDIADTFSSMLHKAEAKFFEHLKTDHKE